MMKRNIVLGLAVVVLLVLVALPPGMFFIRGPHIRELAILGVFCLLAFGVISAIRTQNFNGPRYDSAPGTFGHGAGGPRPNNGQYGFIGPTQTYTVAQALSLEHRKPAVVRGNIVMSLGGDLYSFRDSSGEIILRIGPREWEKFGSNISPSDTIEISGELYRDLGSPGNYHRTPEIHARAIRKL